MSESFYLSQLDIDVTSSYANFSGSDAEYFTGDATADVSIPLSKFISLFQFHVDSDDVTDVSSNDVKFRSVYTQSFPISPLGLDIDTSATVTVDPIDDIATNNNITYDYIRYLAVKIFNTHLGVDLFNNEEILRTSLNNSFKLTLDEILLDIAAVGVTDKTVDTPSRAIFNQILKNAPSRFNDITDYEAEVVNGVQWYYMPCFVGDKVYFLLNVSAAPGQHTISDPLSTDDIPIRKYLICANIVDDPTVLTTFIYSNNTIVTTNSDTLTSNLYVINGHSASDLVSVTVGSNCTTLGDSCFQGCENLTSITISNLVTYIGNNCFNGCGNLLSITIPTLVTYIGVNCFYGCAKLTSMTIPSLVTSLANYCFSGCSKIDSVTFDINSTLTSIGTGCFQNCSSLLSITIPNSVTTFGNSCFQSCSNLLSITIPNSVTSLGDSCFNACVKLDSVILPINSAFKTLSSGCFQNCSNLLSITIPNSVTSLGDSCFNACVKLDSIIIPYGVVNLGSACFYSCEKLVSIVIPSSVKIINDACFAFNSSLTSVTFNDPSVITEAITIMLHINAGSTRPSIQIHFYNTSNYTALSVNPRVSSYFTNPPPMLNNLSTFVYNFYSGPNPITI